MDPVQERTSTLAALHDALGQLEQSMSSLLIPPGGSSFGFALRGARDSSGVAAVNGGIKILEGKPRAAGPCSFGTGEPVVPVILTAMKFDPAVRSAVLLRFSGRALAVFKNDLFLECIPLAPPVNPGISTMDWGIASCCRDGVPDVLYRDTTGTAASRLILFGEGAADVANNIIICSNRI